MPTWDDLRLFLAVARAETLSAAARGLRLDPATLSRRITRLEDQVGTTLFRKSPKGYALTDAGERLRPHAEAAEAAVTAGLDTMLARATGLSGQMRIGAPDGCANYVLPQVCAAISRKNPDLDIQIIALPRVINLSRREADMAIGVSAPTGGRLMVQRITDYHLHLAAHRDVVDTEVITTRADLARIPAVGYIPDMIFDRELDYQSQTPGDPVRLASNSASVQVNLLRQGGSFGFVHDFALPHAPELTRLFASEISLTRSFYLIRHQDDARLDRNRRFATALVEGIRAEVARLESLA